MPPMLAAAAAAGERLQGPAVKCRATGTQHQLEFPCRPEGGIRWAGLAAAALVRHAYFLLSRKLSLKI